jgi:hypothetical protein
MRHARTLPVKKRKQYRLKPPMAEKEAGTQRISSVPVGSHSRK